MEIKHECITCITRQTTTLACKVTDDKEIQNKIITYGLKELSQNCFNYTSLYMTGLIYDYTKEVSGIVDPYEEEKAYFNRASETLIKKHQLKKYITDNSNPLDAAVRLSIAGNIIDFSVGNHIDEGTIKKSLDHSLTTTLFGSDSHTLLKAVNEAKKILFLGDNSGEIVFDKLMIENLPMEKITYVVKGGPIVNDAIMKDAIEVGMDQLVTVVDNGGSVQGTELNVCSKAFLDLFDKADLIISKGQANYESLEGLDKGNIFFLLRAKCGVIAESIGCKQGDFVMLHKT